MFWKKNKLNPINELDFGGHKFKAYAPQELPVARRNIYYQSFYSMNWGLEKEDLIAIAEYLDKNAEDIGQVKYIAKQTADLLRNEYNFRPLVNSAMAFILVDDEKLKSYDSKYLNLKRQMVRDNPEVEAFFLTNAKSLAKHYLIMNDTSKKQEWPSQEMQKSMEKSWLEKIGKTLY